MSKAFNPTTGRLVVPTCQTPSEQEGIQSLFRGAIALFKNPSSHRTVNYEDRLEVIRIIGLAEILLGIVRTAQIRKQIP
jgi:hypothetical protein